MSAVQPRISNAENLKLTEPYSEEVVRRALFQMHPDKAPSIDGFSTLFYQRFWAVIKDDICEEILNFLNKDQLDYNLT